MTRTDQAFVTLATNDSYAIGALVLAESLRTSGTERQLVVMVTQDISPPMRSELQATFDNVISVDVLDSRDTTNLALLARPELGITFTKLHCWRLTQYDKCVFLDADTLVLQNIDELFDCDELAAAPDVGWPDCFNSGVFVYRPSQETYQALLNFALTYGSFDGGDQGLLNAYFDDWSRQGPNKRLSFVYNTTAHAFYSYAPALKRFGQNVKVVHFVGSVKPWHVGYNTSTGLLQGQGHIQTSSANFIVMWWRLFVSRLSPRFAAKMEELGGKKMEGDVWGGDQFFPYKKEQLDDTQRQYAWERGHIDYMGMDAFDNILKQIDTKIVPPPAAANQVTPPPHQIPPVKQVTNNKPPVFPKDSEFSKHSVDSAYIKAPKVKVHRKTMRIPLRDYNQQVKTKPKPADGPLAKAVGSSAPPQVPKPSPVSQAQPSTLPAKQMAAAPAPQPMQPMQPTAPVAKPTAPVVQPTAPVAKPTAPVPQPTALVAKPTAPVVQPTAPVAQTMPSVAGQGNMGGDQDQQGARGGGKRGRRGKK